ncbi:intraflagellar transport protein 56-like [Mizuhopecten yessoensis]|uniref:intraflagellar transport protein 56-like n=1 Tax=Mizuhopecten yessoensis TaxID=6573 RepID=UPI000B45C559|nr:intraflagellar transport protein 56-like [Mizuhopecten yessoensis]
MCFQMLSRQKPAIGPGSTTPAKENKKKKKLPKLEDFLSSRDYTGAITLSEFNRISGKGNEETDLWIAYCAFHLGDYKRAMEEYERMTKHDGCHPDVWINLACCYFFLGMYSESDKAAQRGKTTFDSYDTTAFNFMLSYSNYDQLSS